MNFRKKCYNIHNYLSIYGSIIINEEKTLKKYIIRIFYILILSGIILCIFSAATINSNIYNATEDNAVEILTAAMTTPSDSPVCSYTVTLPDSGISTKAISFYSAHAEVDAYIGDTLIYSLHSPERSFTRTTGYHWNFILLREEFAGKSITLTLHDIYGSTPSEPVIYFGCYDSVFMKIISGDIVNCLVSAAMLIIGITLFLYSIFIIGNRQPDQSLLHFSIFTLLLGIWVFSDSATCALLLPWSVAHVFFAHVSLMLMPIPFLFFFYRSYQTRTNLLWSIYCIFNYVVVFLRLFLQIIGLVDLKQTLWMTHVSFLAFVIIGAYLSIRELTAQKITSQMRLNVICICIILITTVLDLIHFALTSTSSTYGALGFLLYTSIMGINTLKKSRQMMEHAQQNEIYRKLAYTDELTGLFNRTAFRRDMENQTVTDKATGHVSISPTVIFMFDLNDLKKCNDNFGHEYGDQYISTASSLIDEVFGTDGRCYRIGGDEFCVILPFHSQHDVENKVELLRKLFQEKNKQPFVVPITAAIGYAIYDADIDQTLNDTKNRADELMYQDKKEQKKKAAAHV